MAVSGLSWRQPAYLARIQRTPIAVDGGWRRTRPANAVARMSELPFRHSRQQSSFGCAVYALIYELIYELTRP